MALRAFCKADQHFSSYLAEVERQKEISSFVLGQLISHTSAPDAHLIQELPLLGRSDTLPPFFYHRLKRESFPQPSLSLDIAFRYRLQLLSLPE